MSTMDNLTIIVPYYNGHSTLPRLLDSLPPEVPVLVVDDHSDVGLANPYGSNPNVKTIRPVSRGYFAGAVNEGIKATKGDVLIINQDAYLVGTHWLDLIEHSRERCGLIGGRVSGPRPAFPLGYVDGSFMFIRRDVIDKVGLFNAELYPLWGATCEYQLRACRAGFEALPVPIIPDFRHRPDRPGLFGPAMAQAIENEPGRKQDFTRIPPEVSVIIPCRNHGQYLPDAIVSLMPQTFQSFEVVIVDDFSTDDSFEVAQSLADPWKAIRVIRHKENRGTAAAMNTGIENSYGKFIARLDADDMMKPDRLAEMWKLQQENPHSFIFDDVIISGGENMPGSVERGGETIYPCEYDFDRLIHKNGVGCGIMFPRQAWLETGGYPQQFRDGREDWAFNVALGLKGYCGVKAGTPGYIYRREGQNRTLKNRVQQDEFKAMMYRAYLDLYRGIKPMGCCGSSRKENFTAQGSQVAAANGQYKGLPGRDGFEMIEYIGASSADVTWTGRVTGQKYYLGGNKRVGYVDRKDAEFFLQIADHGQKQFRLYVPPVEELQAEIVTAGVLEGVGVDELGAKVEEKPKRKPKAKS